MVKFVSYDGESPNLCRGTLVIEVDGEKWRLENVLESNGDCGFNDDYTESYCYGGSWSVYDLPKALEPYREEIERCVITWNMVVAEGACENRLL